MVYTRKLFLVIGQFYNTCKWNHRRTGCHIELNIYCAPTLCTGHTESSHKKQSHFFLTKKRKVSRAKPTLERMQCKAKLTGMDTKYCAVCLKEDDHCNEDINILIGSIVFVIRLSWFLGVVVNAFVDVMWMRWMCLQTVAWMVASRHEQVYWWTHTLQLLHDSLHSWSP